MTRIASPEDLSTTLLELGSATLGESGAHALPPRLRPVWPGASVAGPAFPVRCRPGDNLAIHVGVAEAPEGSVLVATTVPVAELGYWGEVLTRGALARGLTGLVIDGCVRDTAALAELRFPAFSAGVALPGASKSGPGAVGVTIDLVGVAVHPFDWIVADGDGVVVVPETAIDEIVAAAGVRANRESHLFEQLATGTTTVELFGLDTDAVTRGRH